MATLAVAYYCKDTLGLGPSSVSMDRTQTCMCWSGTEPTVHAPEKECIRYWNGPDPYQFQLVLKRSFVAPLQAGLFQTAGQIPWELTPLLGLVTDLCPLMGYRRKAYLLLVGLTGAHHQILRTATAVPHHKQAPALHSAPPYYFLLATPIRCSPQRTYRHVEATLASSCILPEPQPAPSQPVSSRYLNCPTGSACWWLLAWDPAGAGAHPDSESGSVAAPMALAALLLVVANACTAWTQVIADAVLVGMSQGHEQVGGGQGAGAVLGRVEGCVLGAWGGCGWRLSRLDTCTRLAGATTQLCSEWLLALPVLQGGTVPRLPPMCAACGTTSAKRVSGFPWPHMQKANTSSRNVPTPRLCHTPSLTPFPACPDLQDVASFYQALSWITYTSGAVLSAYSTGVLLDSYGPRPVFVLAAGGLLLDAACAALITEVPVGKEAAVVPMPPAVVAPLAALASPASAVGQRPEQLDRAYHDGLQRTLWRGSDGGKRAAGYGVEGEEGALREPLLAGGDGEGEGEGRDGEEEHGSRSLRNGSVFAAHSTDPAANGSNEGAGAGHEEQHVGEARLAARVLSPRGSGFISLHRPPSVAGSRRTLGTPPGSPGPASRAPQTAAGLIRTVATTLSSPTILAPAVFIFCWQVRCRCHHLQPQANRSCRSGAL